jgi:hypothetical protein
MKPQNDCHLFRPDQSWYEHYWLTDCPAKAPYRLDLTPILAALLQRLRPRAVAQVTRRSTTIIGFWMHLE